MQHVLQLSAQAKNLLKVVPQIAPDGKVEALPVEKSKPRWKRRCEIIYTAPAIRHRGYWNSRGGGGTGIPEMRGGTGIPEMRGGTGIPEAGRGTGLDDEDDDDAISL